MQTPEYANIFAQPIKAKADEAETHTGSSCEMGITSVHTLSLLMCAVSARSIQAQSAGWGPLSELHLSGDYSFAGMFPLHNLAYTSNLPDLQDCSQGIPNIHGYHLMQAMRFAIEQINNGTANGALLPGVKLGYQIYDICSMSASALSTLELLAQQYTEDVGQSAWDGVRAIAVIGPDSSSYSFITAPALAYYLVPEISYEASNEMLSNKKLYPTFFRTIPSDRNQVMAMIELLVKFNWTWIALLGSDNDYGLQGMLSLSQLAPSNGICIAYQGVIPTYSAATRPQIKQMVKSILQTHVTTVVVFSSKRIVSGFFQVVIEQNVTDKVWIGTEDWSVAKLVSGIPGIQTIGSVLGVSIKSAMLPGLKEFEDRSIELSRQSAMMSQNSANLWNQAVPCLQNSTMSMLTSGDLSMGMYDITSAFNVYKAVYALAHALHLLLSCDSGTCQKMQVKPWQLLQALKQVRFSIENTSMYFDSNGDPPTGYDIVAWDWTGGLWSLPIIGSYSPNPSRLKINISLIKWNSNTPNVIPVSVCSPECPTGYKRILNGQHKCCFDCEACLAATFLNKSDPTSCQSCTLDEWAPPESEQCFNRTVIYLPWDEPMSVALLVVLALTMLLTLGTALTFLLHLNTPVVKSAGGRTCLVMLTALLGAAGSAFCHFGLPRPMACLLKQPLFTFSITVCLACVAVRSIQVVCIFKLANRLPRAYETWAKNNGPQVVIAALSGTELFISLVRVSSEPPRPTEDHQFYDDAIVLECSGFLWPGAAIELAYVALLSGLCFGFSYMGKDLPANYNEAKCITFSLLIYIISWISVFTMYSVSRDEFVMALHVGAILASVLGMLGGYFLPKMYIILLKPQMNTTAHFQNCIQMYTMSKE
ncbi:taste receptor type 1 member 1 [Scleropages formosus]|uniref:Taste receptor, type 1, member 1 n=1 Tax=Scleropages formosus TaxID=113540 RepID=A0A8C9TR26_SCLFO|nr:taste receptor type 1 member 1-like [Scleropages formosus]